MNIALIQLGCPKNIVDGEWVLGQLVAAGHKLVPFNEAEALLINTCAFINPAKEESLTAIIEAVEEKKKGKLKKVIVFGCLSERYGRELKKELKEVDAFFPLSAIGKAAVMLDGSDTRFPAGELPLPDRYYPRKRMTPPHMAYVKIGDGCSHKCSFCAIPKIRGGFKSRNAGSVLTELKELHLQGVKEAVLVAQDSTRWSGGLNNLMAKMEKSETPEWIRILYLYPSKITDDLLLAWRDSEKILPYFDIPFQHCSEKVLRSMKRSGNCGSYIGLVDKIRKTIPGAAIRTSLIVGFPTEGKKEFAELKNFLEEADLDNVGFFAYSREEGTSAFELGDIIPEEEKTKRLEEAALVQREISLRKNREKVKKKFKTLVEGVSSESDLLLEGRAYFQAPEIDGKIFINKGKCSAGQFSTVKISRGMDYDLVGEALNGR